MVEKPANCSKVSLRHPFLEATKQLVVLKTLYVGAANLMAGAGVAEWLTRQPRDQTARGQKPQNGKIAGGLRARRGSNPFPGATSIILDNLLVFGGLLGLWGQA
jgi:hypothetical protein